MPKRSGKMNQREREICLRLKVFREEQNLSQRNFAELLGISRDQLTGIEYGHTPLNFGTAIRMASVTGCNLKWLADGAGPKRGPLPDPDLTGGIPPRQSFSHVWKTHLKGALLSGRSQFGAQLVTGGTVGDASARDYCNEEITGVFDDLPPEHHSNFFAWIAKACGDYYRVNGFTIAESRLVQRPSPEKKDFTKKESGITLSADMKNQWPVLKRRLRRATANSGAKSKLAKFLSVELPRISQWLTEAKSAREPGAEYALQMLYWVEHPELQK